MAVHIVGGSVGMCNPGQPAGGVIVIGGRMAVRLGGQGG